jgi:hypothetical protein
MDAAGGGPLHCRGFDPAYHGSGISAVRAALRRVRSCVITLPLRGMRNRPVNKGDQRRKVEELMEVVSRAEW